MNNKWMCGIAALGFMVSSVFAKDSYFVFEDGATNGNTAYGYMFGYGYSDAAPPSADCSTPDGATKITVSVFRQGVAALSNVNLVTTNADGVPYPGVGISIKNPTSPPAPENVIGDCTGGFSYWYIGDKHRVEFEFDPTTICATGIAADEIPYDNKWFYEAASAAAWTKATMIPSSIGFPNATWGACDASFGSKGDAQGPPYDGTQVNQIAWGFNDKLLTNPSSGTSFKLAISNIVCLTGTSDISNDDPPAVTVDFADVSDCTPSSSSSGGVPIQQPQPSISITGLNVAHFARSLHIASGKDATVSLFDMHGKQVFSKKVLAGESVVSLENQRQGVYYAVVRSGSFKQTVKVVLK